jgi:hypothetical protein
VLLTANLWNLKECSLAWPLWLGRMVNLLQRVRAKSNVLCIFYCKLSIWQRYIWTYCPVPSLPVTSSSSSLPLNYLKHWQHAYHSSPSPSASLPLNPRHIIVPTTTGRKYDGVFRGGT